MFNGTFLKLRSRAIRHGPRCVMHDRFVIDCLLFLFLNILCVARPIITDLASWVIFRDKAAPMDIRLERHETKPNLGRKGNRAQKPGMRPHGVCGF